VGIVQDAAHCRCIYPGSDPTSRTFRTTMESITQKMTSLLGGHAKKLESTELPVGTPGKPYVISSQDGEIIYIPGSKSATRLLITGKESENAFAVVASGGSESAPIGFHYHRETHDVFLCLQGACNVWAGEKCRTMTAGDFASVPPVGTIQQTLSMS
jgi:quercetin dioxygenase-like cupin family protein